MIKAFISLLFLLFSFLSLQATEIKSIGYYRDANHTVHFDTIQTFSDDAFTNVPLTKIPYFGYTHDQIWFRVIFTKQLADSNKHLIEIGFPTLDQVDAYIPTHDGYKTYHVGDKAPFSNRPVKHRLFVFPINDTHAEQTIYFRVESEGTINVPIKLYTPEMLREKSQFNYGAIFFFYGALIAILLYNLMLFFSIRDRLYLIYVGFGTFMLIGWLAHNGIGAEYLWSNMPRFGHASYAGGFSIGSFFATWLVREFTQSQTINTYLDKILALLMFIFLIAAVLSFVGNYTLGAFLLSATGILAATTAMVAGFWSILKGNKSARFFVLAWFGLLTAIVVLSLSNLGLIEVTALTTNSMQIGSFLELLLLSLALADRLVYLRKEREGLLEQSRFFAIGQAIGNIGHQWKIPLTQVATISTMIESTLKHDRSKLSSNIEKALPDLKLSIEQMKETLAEFSQFYRTKRDKKTFSPYQVLQKNVIQLLSSKIMLKNVQINLDFDADFTMTNYEHIFANIMMILIDNSIDAFEKNHNNKITILITRHKDHLVLNYSDNAGGIKVKPIEKVFEYFISTKEKEGHGLGLPMVKMLVEERMNGSITLKNISDGVQFTIHFPY